MTPNAWERAARWWRDSHYKNGRMLAKPRSKALSRCVEISENAANDLFYLSDLKSLMSFRERCAQLCDFNGAFQRTIERAGR